MSEKVLKKNVINVWGAKGRGWLEQLPGVIKALSNEWSLAELRPVNNMSYNYVALAMQESKTPVALKISCDQQLILSEYNALRHFDGHGAIKLLDMNTKHHALLLEQAVPGDLLKEQHPCKIENTIDLYAQVVNALATRSYSGKDCLHVREWLKAIDRIKDKSIERHYINKAKELKEYLLSSAEDEYLCHGDLHLENIIQQGDSWVAIDPQGIVGEMAFEAAAFDLLGEDEMKIVESLPTKITDRVTILSRALGLDFNRLLLWIFVRVIISAQWFIEDNGDPSDKLSLAKIIYPLLRNQ